MKLIFFIFLFLSLTSYSDYFIVKNNVVIGSFNTFDDVFLDDNNRCNISGASFFNDPENPVTIVKGSLDSVYYVGYYSDGYSVFESVKNKFVTNILDREVIGLLTPESLFSWRQGSKPLEQRQYENQFYALTEQLFNLTGVTNEVTPKLGFPELQAKIEAIQATDPMTAVNLSLKLLTIDAALKRYNTLWWEDAIQHELPEN